MFYSFGADNSVEVLTITGAPFGAWRGTLMGARRADGSCLYRYGLAPKEVPIIGRPGCILYHVVIY